MLFDAQLQVANMEVAPAEDHVQMAVMLALSLPVGPDQVAPLPAGIVRFAIGKDMALLYGQQLLDAGNSLEDPKPAKPASDLVVAQSLQGVEKVAAANAAFKGAKS